jgi:DNA mismatch repair protein MutL
VTRSSADHVHVAVNGRVVRDDAVRRAVESAYGSLLPDGRHPVAVVRLDVPPETVDANVHPAKREVAHADADAAAGVVERAVRDALSTADLRRAGDVAMDLDSALSPPGGETDSRLADATYLGQFRGTYLLLEADDDLLVVDQHAAHERVNFERLRAAVGAERAGDGSGGDGRVPTRRLDPPETVSLPPGEAATVEAERETLRALGFDADPFGGGTVRLRTVPAPLGRVADTDAFREAVAALHGGDAPDPDDARDDLLADLACHPSLKAGDELDDADARGLVDRLAACERPFACPHGRPTVLTVEESALIRGFERGTRLG